MSQDGAEGGAVATPIGKRPLPDSIDPRPSTETKRATLSIKLQFGKFSKLVELDAAKTVGDLKIDIERETGVPVDKQKLIFKGQLKDGSTLREAGLKSNSKLMILGTRPVDSKIIQESTPKGGLVDDFNATSTPERWCDMAKHKKILEKGRPDDGWSGIKDRQVPLRDDQSFIPGLLNSQGSKVRLTFKDGQSELWIGSAQHTQRIAVATIHKIEAQTITGQEEYSILRIQIGSAGEFGYFLHTLRWSTGCGVATQHLCDHGLRLFIPSHICVFRFVSAAANSYWLYFVPSQCVSGIKLRVLGVEALLE